MIVRRQLLNTILDARLPPNRFHELATLQLVRKYWTTRTCHKALHTTHAAKAVARVEVAAGN